MNTRLVYILIGVMAFISSCHEETKIPVPTNKQPIAKQLYTCSMHPEIIRDAPGKCPICGMDLVSIVSNGDTISGDTLSFLIKPADKQVVLKIAVISPEEKTIKPEFTYEGFVNFIPQESGTVASKVTGRIEKIYVTYNYQQVSKGQKLMEIYNPELLTEQSNLLFLSKEDTANNQMIAAARNKLKLLGLSQADLNLLETNKKPSRLIPVYSAYNGFVTEPSRQNSGATGMAPSGTSASSQLTIKEGSYVQKGQTVFSIINSNKLWALINIPMNDLSFIKKGNKVRIKPESNSDNEFEAEINYIEPVLDNTKKTGSARVIFDNTKYKLPIGSQLTAVVFADSITGLWLPQSAVINLGKQRVVLLKSGIGFKVKVISTSNNYKGLIKVISGITAGDQVAINAQFVMDSESFIKEEQQ